MTRWTILAIALLAPAAASSQATPPDPTVTTQQVAPGIECKLLADDAERRRSRQDTSDCNR